MKIWVDADAVPHEIKEIIVKGAVRLQLETIFVANKAISLPSYPNLNSVKVGKGFDVADGYIEERAAAGDLVISQDIPLAGLLVAKGIPVIDPRGHLLDEATIGERLSVRNFMDELRGAGVQTGGPRPFDTKAKQRFASTFDRELTRLHRLVQKKAPS